MTAEDTLYIDADEEITSVIDKLTESQAPTILLVVPKGAMLLQSVVNLKLLKKEAEEKGKNIALVTTDTVGRNLAAQVGLTVYHDIESREPIVAPGREERPSIEETIEVDMSGGIKEPPVRVHHYLGGKEEKPLQQRYETGPLTYGFRKRRFAIGAASSIFALAGILFLYPKTTVVLGVKSQPFESTIEITIDKKIAEVNRNSSILPGRELSKEKEKTTTATATGKKIVGEKATGSVTVYNCYQSVPLTLSLGTTLTSGGKSFVTRAAVTVPAAVIIGSNCTTAGQEAVAVEAAAVGADHNLLANSTFCSSAYPCFGGTYVNAKNQADLTGGTSREVTTLKQEDINAAVNQAKEELFADALSEVKSEAKSQNLRILDAAVDQQIVEQTSDKTVGTEASDAQVTTKVRVRTLAFNESDYRQMIVDLLTLRLPADKKLVLSGEDEIVTTVTEANWDEGFVKIKGEVKTHTIDAMAEEEIKSSVRATTLGAAERRLQELPNVVEVRVETVPRFLNRTALLNRNIIVKIEAK